MLQTERVPTGIVGLDHLIEGGLPKGRSILITGEPGTGKTIFALQFLVDGLRRGEKGIYVSADESPMDVLEQGASLGWDLERHVDVQKAVSDLASFVNQVGAKRMVLDPAGPFVLLRDSAARIQDQTRLLVKLLRTSMQTTNVLTSYAVPRTGERSMHGIEEYLVAGAIVLEMIWKGDGLIRTLIVEKMRCTNVKPTQLEFDIAKGVGITIQPPASAF
jgi:circadian clock protein KaiC